jgi:hypothetical protein
MWIEIYFGLINREKIDILIETNMKAIDNEMPYF